VFVVDYLRSPRDLLVIIDTYGLDMHHLLHSCLIIGGGALGCTISRGTILYTMNAAGALQRKRQQVPHVTLSSSHQLIPNGTACIDTNVPYLIT